MTRAPRVRVSLTFSAISRQHTTSKKDVASSHSWVWRFCQRRLTASPKEAVGWPGVGEAQFGVPGDVAHQDHAVIRRHRVLLSSLDSSAPAQLAAGWAAALRPPADSGSRTILWRTTSSASPSMRSRSATVWVPEVNSTTT